MCGVFEEKNYPMGVRSQEPGLGEVRDQNTFHVLGAKCLGSVAVWGCTWAPPMVFNDMLHEVTPLLTVARTTRTVSRASSPPPSFIAAPAAVGALPHSPRHPCIGSARADRAGRLETRFLNRPECSEQSSQKLAQKRLIFTSKWTTVQ